MCACTLVLNQKNCRVFQKSSLVRLNERQTKYYAKAPSVAKSSHRTPGETSQRNTPSASIVEIASSRVLEHLPLLNLVIEHQVNPCPSCAVTDKYTFGLYSRSCKLQSTKAPSAVKSSNRALGETLQRNTPSTSIVQVASSRCKSTFQH